MKNFLTITILVLPIGIFAQGPNSTMNDDSIIQTTIENQQANSPAQAPAQSFFFDSENKKDKPCKDCEEVKQAIKASHASSGNSQHKKSFSIKAWAKKSSGKANIKMKKIFGKKYKAKTSYSICFNWD